MCDSNYSRELKNRDAYQFEKSPASYPRNPGVYARQRFLLPRRRAMPGSNPSRGICPFNRSQLRTNALFSMGRGIPNGYRNQLSTNNPFQPTTQDYSNTPPTSYSRNTIYASPHIPEMQNYSGNRMEPVDWRSTQTSEESSSKIWMEAFSPTGRKYCYSSRARETAWRKPINTRIVKFDEIVCLSANSELEQTQIPQIQRQESFVQPLLNSTCPNSLYHFPRKFSVASPKGFLMFPPPSTPCYYPPMFTELSNTFLANTIDGKFDVSVPPPTLPFSIFPRNSENNNADFNIDNNRKASLMDSIRNHTQAVIPEEFGEEKELIYTESKILDLNATDSEASLSSSGSAEQITCTADKAVESVHVGGKSNKHKTRDDSVNLNSGESPPKQSKLKYSAKKEPDKSRPVTSTPIQGTCWSIVWTGDERVFFYDYKRNVSFWERPKELLNRSDVDKLVEKPVLPKLEKLETGPNESNGCAKKMPKHHGEVGNSENKNERSVYTSDVTGIQNDNVHDSRPVSSNTVPSTCLNVVLKKDDKISSDGCQKKVSVLERPNELLNRSEVAKLVEKQDLSKHEIIETVPNINNGGAKKMAKHHGEVGDSENLKERSACTSDVTSIQKDEAHKFQPVCSTTVHGTCRNVIWKGNENIFFCNSQRKTSFWKRPNALLNRSDVDILVQKTDLSKHEETESVPNDDGVKKITKFNRQDDNSKNRNYRTMYLSDEKELKGNSYEKKVKEFYKMLEEKNVSASSSWGKEIFKIVDDPRFLSFSSPVMRRKVFANFIFEKMEGEKRDLQKKLKNKRDNFLSLLAEAGISSKTRFIDFVERYQKDDRFKAFDKIQQLEQMFHKYLSAMITKGIDSDK